MAARSGRAGGLPVGFRREWSSKEELLAGGSSVVALEYSRASQDKKGQAKSVGDQRKLNLAEAARRSWTLRDEHLFMDNDRSASRYSRKEREQFPLLLETIRSGVGDVLIMFELARGQRDMAVYVRLRELCLSVGLNYWLLGGRLFDLRDRYDRQSLNNQAAQAEDLSDAISENVQRGINGAAEAGRPTGNTPYGYVRKYDEHTRALLGQYADETLRTATAADGTVTEYSRAGVVRELFRMIDQGTSLKATIDEFNRRGVPSPSGAAWRHNSVRKMAMNPAYVAKRVLRREIVADGIWEPLVDAEIFWAVNERLSDVKRTTTRPGKSKWLASYWVTCGKCGAPFGVDSDPKSKEEREIRVNFKYICNNKKCSSVMMAALDEFIQSAAIAFLSLEDTARRLQAATAAGNEAAAAARAEISRLKTELEAWTRQAEEGQVSVTAFARVEKRLSERIAEAEQAAKSVGVPESLRGLVGPDAAVKWAGLGDDVAAKRDALKRIMTVAVDPAGKSRRPLKERVRFGGPIAGEAL